MSRDRYETRSGIDRQADDCRELAAERGAVVVEVYTENNKSAWRQKRVREVVDGVVTVVLRGDRPVFRQMLADLRAGKLDVVIGYNLDRLGSVGPFCV